MKKILGFMMMVGLLAMPSHASDNRSAPNVFSSVSTISSSKMNENFNFLASEMRENLVGGPGLPNVNVPPGNVPAHIREGLRQSFGDGPKDSPTIEEERRKRRGVFKFRTN